MGKIWRHLFFAIIAFSGQSIPLSAQSEVEDAMFWEVRGKDLSSPSFLFGTFHLLGSRYVDSLTQVMNNFNQCKTFVGEILIDSSMTMKMMIAARLDNTSLDKLLTPADYQKTAVWLRELSGYELNMFNGMNPMAIQIFLMTMLQDKYFPSENVSDDPMDIYFQKEGKRVGKKLVGLETFDTQIHALFTQFTLERQVAMLTKFVDEKEKAKGELIQLNKSYRNGNLSQLELLLADQTYTKQEAEVMLDLRNKQWIEQLPSLMKIQPTFVAVGALHLAGKNGLVNLLRQAGYTVTPMAVK
ncbi:MAG: TraB/GumN family protein [Chryseolinea sp.]